MKFFPESFPQFDPQPTIVISVGGSGTAIGYVAQELVLKYGYSDNQANMRDSNLFKFVAIDSKEQMPFEYEEAYYSNSSFYNNSLINFDMIGIASEDYNKAIHDENYPSRQAGENRPLNVMRNLPPGRDYSIKQKDPSLGMAQNPAKSHIHFMLSWNRTWDKLHSLLLQWKESITHTNPPRNGIVFITAGLWGGTGSGAFIDVGAMVRLILKDLELEHTRVYGIFLLPGLLGPEKKSLPDTNAFSALLELDYFISGNPYCLEFSTGKKEISNETGDKIFDYTYLLDDQNDNLEMVTPPSINRETAINMAGRFIYLYGATEAGRELEVLFDANVVEAIPLYKSPQDWPVSYYQRYSSFGISTFRLPYKKLYIKLIEKFSFAAIDALFQESNIDKTITSEQQRRYLARIGLGDPSVLGSLVSKNTNATELQKISSFTADFEKIRRGEITKYGVIKNILESARTLISQIDSDGVETLIDDSIKNNIKIQTSEVFTEIKNEYPLNKIMTFLQSLSHEEEDSQRSQNKRRSQVDNLSQRIQRVLNSIEIWTAKRNKRAAVKSAAREQTNEIIRLFKIINQKIQNVVRKIVIEEFKVETIRLEQDRHKVEQSLKNKIRQKLIKSNITSDETIVHEVPFQHQNIQEQWFEKLKESINWQQNYTPGTCIKHLRENTDTHSRGRRFSFSSLYNGDEDSSNFFVQYLLGNAEKAVEESARSIWDQDFLSSGFLLHGTDINSSEQNEWKQNGAKKIVENLFIKAAPYMQLRKDIESDHEKAIFWIYPCNKEGGSVPSKGVWIDQKSNNQGLFNYTKECEGSLPDQLTIIRANLCFPLFAYKDLIKMESVFLESIKMSEQQKNTEVNKNEEGPRAIFRYRDTRKHLITVRNLKKRALSKEEYISIFSWATDISNMGYKIFNKYGDNWVLAKGNEELSKLFLNVDEPKYYPFQDISRKIKALENNLHWKIDLKRKIIEMMVAIAEQNYANLPEPAKEITMKYQSYFIRQNEDISIDLLEAIQAFFIELSSCEISEVKTLHADYFLDVRKVFTYFHDLPDDIKLELEAFFYVKKITPSVREDLSDEYIIELLQNNNMFFNEVIDRCIDTYKKLKGTVIIPNSITSILNEIMGEVTV